MAEMKREYKKTKVNDGNRRDFYGLLSMCTSACECSLKKEMLK
jgi:hypothetical protein